MILHNVNSIVQIRLERGTCYHKSQSLEECVLTLLPVTVNAGTLD